MKLFSGRFRSKLAVFSIFFLVFAAVMAAAPPPSSAFVSFGFSVTIAPPPIPVYVQPACPAPGYIWVPGYWNWDPNYGYYWVPGTWVVAPFAGALWTPGYWGWSAYNTAFVWYPGYWGPVVGFYGGINYGFGYTGYGYAGGYWRGGNFYYNRTVNNINITNIRNVYRRPVVVRNTSRVSFNGGRGGIVARPTRTQLAAARQRRMGPIAAQNRQVTIARTTPRLRANFNHGRPSIAATQRPGIFRRNVVPARRAGGPFRPAPVRPSQQRRYTRPGAPGRYQFGPSQRRQFTPGGRGPAIQRQQGGRGVYGPGNRRLAPQGQRPAPQRQQRKRRQPGPGDGGPGGGPGQGGDFRGGPR